MQEMQFWSLGSEDPLEKEMTTHSNILAWKIPWTQVSGRLQSMGLHRVEHDWGMNMQAHEITFTVLTIYKCIAWLHQEHSRVLQPSPPSTPRTFSSSWNWNSVHIKHWPQPWDPPPLSAFVKVTPLGTWERRTPSDLPAGTAFSAQSLQGSSVFVVRFTAHSFVFLLGTLTLKTDNQLSLLGPGASLSPP